MFQIWKKLTYLNHNNHHGRTKPISFLQGRFRWPVYASLYSSRDEIYRFPRPQSIWKVHVPLSVYHYILFWKTISLITIWCRIFWSISLLGALVYSVILISQIFENYFKNPIIISYMPEESTVSQIPFPAVTLCNVNILKDKLVQESLRYANNINGVKTIKMNSLRLNIMF